MTTAWSPSGYCDFLPDYSHLVNLYIWQTLDLRPRYPRIHEFLDHWRREIDAVIKEIAIFDAGIRTIL